MLWFVPLLLLGIRPVATGLGLLGITAPSRVQRRMIGWFGIRGIGSLYYLCYALHHGLPPDLAARLTALTLAVVAVSIVVHGLSVTPLMTLYGTWQARARAASSRRRAERSQPRAARRKALMPVPTCRQRCMDHNPAEGQSPPSRRNV